MGRARGFMKRGNPMSVSLRLNIMRAGPGMHRLCVGWIGKYRDQPWSMY